MTISTLLIVIAALLAIAGGIAVGYFNREPVEAALVSVGASVLGAFVAMLVVAILEDHQVQLDTGPIKLGGFMAITALTLSTIAAFAWFGLHSQRTTVSKPPAIHRY